MNRKRWFISLAVLLPLVLLGTAKWATLWRPVVIGRVPRAGMVSEASNRYLRVSGVRMDATVPGDTVLFDLKTGVQTYQNRANTGIFRDWTWSIETRNQPQLTLRRGNDSFVYPIRNCTGNSEIQAFVIAPERDCVQLFMGGRYYQWSFQSRRLEREFQIPFILGDCCAFSHDGKTLIQAGIYATALFSTRDGRTLSYLPKSPNPKSRVSATGISEFGSYIISGNFRVAEARSGRVLWEFNPAELGYFDASLSN